jgi:two-component system cell cycle response regulator CtrA
MHVLIVEDDPVTAAKIEIVLQSQDFLCDAVEFGRAALTQAKEFEYDIIVLDLMLPDMDGYDVLRQLRSTGVRTPVLILSGLGELDDKVKGLSFGADDYLTKPFEERELIARIQAIVRRSKGDSGSAIRTGKIVVDLASRTATIDDRRLAISPKEYEILEQLSLRKGATLTKEFLLQALYGGIDEPDLRIIDVFV